MCSIMLRWSLCDEWPPIRCSKSIIMWERAGSGCVYVHCYAHRLNLVVVNTASSISNISEFFGVMEAAYTSRFITVSSLRHDKFVDAQRDKTWKWWKFLVSDTWWVCGYIAVCLFKEFMLQKALPSNYMMAVKWQINRVTTSALKCHIHSTTLDIWQYPWYNSDTLEDKDLDLAWVTTGFRTLYFFNP